MGKQQNRVDDGAATGQWMPTLHETGRSGVVEMKWGSVLVPKTYCEVPWDCKANSMQSPWRSFKSKCFWEFHEVRKERKKFCSEFDSEYGSNAWVFKYNLKLISEKVKVNIQTWRVSNDIVW